MTKLEMYLQSEPKAREILQNENYINWLVDFLKRKPQKEVPSGQLDNYPDNMVKYVTNVLDLSNILSIKVFFDIIENYAADIYMYNIFGHYIVKFKDTVFKVFKVCYDGDDWINIVFVDVKESKVIDFDYILNGIYSKQSLDVIEVVEKLGKSIVEFRTEASKLDIDNRMQNQIIDRIRN